MGGAVEITPERTPAEITVRLIEIGRNAKVPDPHTVWVVQDPTLYDRELDHLCYAIPVGHLAMFPFGRLHLETQHITFYAYKYRQEALEDAKSRLAKEK